MVNWHDDHDNMSLLEEVTSASGELSLTPLQCVSDMHEEHHRIAHSLEPHG